MLLEIKSILMTGLQSKSMITIKLLKIKTVSWRKNMIFKLILNSTNIKNYKSMILEEYKINRLFKSMELILLQQTHPAVVEDKI
jgi:hypothetical protein